MFATIRRYESIDQSRTSELVKKADETLLPSLSELPGFSGYYLIEAGDGVMSSISFFDTSEHADESTRVASNWVREQKLETALRTRRRSPAARSSCRRRASSSRRKASKPFAVREKARSSRAFFSVLTLRKPRHGDQTRHQSSKPSMRPELVAPGGSRWTDNRPAVVPTLGFGCCRRSHAHLRVARAQPRATDVGVLGPSKASDAASVARTGAGISAAPAITSRTRASAR